MADFTLSAKVTGDSSGFEKAFSTAQKTLDSFYAKVQSFTKKLDSIGNTFTDVGDKLTSRITKPAITATSALTGLTLVKGFNRLTGIDDAKAKLKGLGHDAESVTEIMNSAMESVKGTSYGMDAAATTAASAVAAGIQPGKELTRYLSLTADAAAIAGASMADMGSIINKVQTSQIAYTDDLNQLADRGLPIYQWLAEAAGITAAEVKEMASEGQISSQMFLDAIEKNIGGAAKIMGESSFTAAISNIGASISRIGANFLDAGGKGGGFFSTLKPMLADFNNSLGILEDKAADLGVRFGEAFSSVISGIQGLKARFDSLSPSMQGLIIKGAGIGTAVAVGLGPALKIAGKLTTGFSSVLGVVSMIASPAGMALAAITALASGFAYLMKTNESFRTGVTAAWDAVSGKIQSALSGLMPVLSGVFEGIRAKFQDMLSALSNADFSGVFAGLQGFAESVKSLVSGIDLSGFYEILQTASGKVQSFVSGIDFSGVVEKVQGVAEKIREFASGIDFSGAVEKIKSLIPTFEEISSAVSLVISTISEKVQTLYTFFQTVFSGLNIPVAAFITGFTAILINGSGPLGTFASKVLAVGTSLTKGIGSVVPKILPALTNLFARFHAGGGVIGLLKGGLSGLGSAFAGLFSPVTLIVGAIALLAAGFTTLMATNESFRNTVISLGQNILAALIPAFQMISQTVSQIIATVLPVLISLFNQILPIIGQIVIVVMQVAATLAPMITQLVSTLLPVITNIITVLSNVASAVMPAIIAILNVVMSVIQTLIPIIMDVLSVVVSVVSGIISAVNPIISFIGSVISAVMAIISPIVTFISDIIATVIQVIGTIIGTVTGIFSTVFSIISGVFSNISNFISTVINAVSTVISTLTGVVGSVFNSIYSVVSSVMGNVRSFITGVFNGIKSAWNGLTSFVSGVFSGIASAVNQLVSQVKGFVNGVISGINAAVGLINMIPGVSIGYIPYLARGTDDWQGGFARMNEGGRGELTYLPNGTQVIPHDISVKYAKEAARINHNSADGAVIDYDRLINGIAAAMSGVKVESSMNVGGRTLAKVIAPLINDRMGVLNTRAEMG